MSVNFKHLIFILGIQRSGTTWLGNIFDSSPDTNVFMEPFAPGCAILPEFPDHTHFFRNSSDVIDELLRTKMMDRLVRGKYLFIKKSMVEPWHFKLERLLSNLISSVYWIEPSWLKRRRQTFHELNFNRFDKKHPLYKKKPEPLYYVIKEVRLAGKIPILMSAFQKARYVVIVRHPAANVYSIINMFNKGHLGELRREIDTYIERIETQEVANRYHTLIERCRKGTLAHKIALYWRISYETIYDQLKNNPAATFVLYEQLALTPIETVSNLFESLKIPFAFSVNNYINYSSSFKPNKVTPHTTVRNSAESYREWCKKIEDTTMTAVQEIAGDSPFLSWFAPYYSNESIFK